MPWGLVYYRTADGRVPADEFFHRCPDKVEATILAVPRVSRARPAIRRRSPSEDKSGGASV